MVAELIKTNRSYLLNIDGYLYAKVNEKNGRVNWKCMDQCGARAVTRAQLTHGQAVEVLRGPNESPHNDHLPDQDEVEAQKLKHKLKRKAVEHPEAPPAQLCRTELHAVPSAVLAKLPDRVNLTKAVQRVRLRNMPTNPTDLDDLEELPERYTQTFEKENFLLYDSFVEDEVEDVGRLLVFSTKENLRRLMRSSEWFVDGTFKVVPHIFFQLFAILATFTQVVRGVEHKVALPLVYALMDGKSEAAYKKVFEIVNESCTKFGIHRVVPLFVMSDFELGILNAVNAVFNCTVKACFFHLRQSVFRQIQAKGLQEAYNNEEDRAVKNAAKMMCATAFVPLEDVVEAFNNVEKEVPESFKPITTYFSEWYVKGIVARGRRRGSAPRYPPQLWNMYDATLQNLARTNNLSEGWHTRFSIVVGKNHPSLYAFLTELQKEQSDTESMIRDIDVGKRIKKARSRKNQQTEDRISNLVIQYDQKKDDILKYLLSVGHLIQL